MSLYGIANGIAEDAHFAIGEMTRNERVNRATAALSDYVYWAMNECGITRGVIDARVYNSIARIVASAMIAQFERDEASSDDLVRAIVTDARIPEHPEIRG